MGEPLRMVLLCHRHRVFSRGEYLIEAICQEWEREGHVVSVINGIGEPLPDADLAVLHVDLTVVPPGYVRALDRYPLVLNRNITDISKSRFSTVVLGPDDDYDGPVIVKTEKNYGGLIERRVKQMEGSPQPELRARIPWEKRKWLLNYPVFKSLRNVPAGIWSNRHLIVEKFLPESDDQGRYTLRIWVFLGDQEVHYRNISREPLIKSGNTIGREYLPVSDVPPELRLVRERLGVDYGKFDYAVHGKGPVLFDVNKTPAIPQGYISSAEQFENIRQLSLGLAYFAEGATVR